MENEIKKRDIGKAILKGIKKRGWSQVEFAKNIGADKAKVNSWVSGRFLPQADILCTIIRFLDIHKEVFPELKCTEPSKQETEDILIKEIFHLKKKIDEIEKRLDNQDTKDIDVLFERWAATRKEDERRKSALDRMSKTRKKKLETVGV